MRQQAGSTLGDIGSILWGGVAGLLAILLAIALLRLGTAGFGLVAPPDAEAVPLLQLLGLAAGLCLGVALLAALPDGGAFRPGRIFGADGSWAFGLPGLLGDHALPQPATFARALQAMRTADGIGGLAGWLASAVLAGGAFIALRWWQGFDRLRALAALVLLACCIALLLHYGAHLLAWLAAQLSFWLFGVLLVVFQRWRYAAKGSH